MLIAGNLFVVYSSLFYRLIVIWVGSHDMGKKIICFLLFTSSNKINSATLASIFETVWIDCWSFPIVTISDNENDVFIFVTQLVILIHCLKKSNVVWFVSSDDVKLFKKAGAKFGFLSFLPILVTGWTDFLSYFKVRIVLADNSNPNNLIFEAHFQKSI